jgi:hypothetical protein
MKHNAPYYKAAGVRHAAVTRIIRSDIPSDHPIGGWFLSFHSVMLGAMLLEIGIVLLSILCFVLLDLYVVGCERV